MEAIQLPTGEWSLVETHQGVYQTKEEARLAAEQILVERAQMETVLKEAISRLPHEQLVDFMQYPLGKVSMNSDTVPSGDELLHTSDAPPIPERGEGEPPSNHKNEFTAMNFMPENEKQYPPDTLVVAKEIPVTPVSLKDDGRFMIHRDSHVKLRRGTPIKRVGDERGYEIWKAFCEVEGYEYIGTWWRPFGEKDELGADVQECATTGGRTLVGWWETRTALIPISGGGDTGQIACESRTTVLGSTAGEGQQWSVDSIADEIAHKIMLGEADERLSWLTNGSVRVQMAKIFPTHSGYQHTVQERRRRLKAAVIDRLRRKGWEHLGRTTFGHRTPQGS